MRIGGAVLVAVLLVGGAYVLPGLRFPETKAVNAELTDELLANYVSKDTDKDELPDWQESLYGTDPQKADTDGDGITDGDAVRRGMLTPTTLASQLPQEPIGEEEIPGEAPAPGSFTDRFARSLLETSVRAGAGQAMTAEAQQTLVASLMQQFRQEAAQSLASKATRISVRSNPSMSATGYAASVESALDATIPDAPDSDMFKLAQRVIEQDDASAAARLDTLGSQYLRASQALVAVSVPSHLVDSHAKLIQGFEEAGRAAMAISEYEEDPILTMAALAMLLPARDKIMVSFTTIAESLLLAGEPAAGAGAEIVDIVRREQLR